MGKAAHSYQMCISNFRLPCLYNLNRYLTCPDIPIGHLVEMLGFAHFSMISGGSPISV